jgi:Flp pilus assembly protein TadG
MDFAIRRNMRAEGQKGASAIEFAILLPLLVVILFGIVEFSILFYDKAVITNASREGAREGIVFQNPRYEDDALLGLIDSVVTTYCGNRLITFGTPSSVQTSIPNSSPGVTTYTKGVILPVTVQYQFKFLVLSNVIKLVAPGSSFASGITLEAVTQMRME